MQAINGIKVYSLKDTDVAEWFAGRSVEDVTTLAESMGYDDAQMEELSDEAMDKLQHTGNDGTEGAPYPQSFRAELLKDLAEGVEFPCLFASAEI